MSELERQIYKMITLAVNDCTEPLETKIEQLQAENQRLRRISGDLAGWAAAINWDGRKNAKEWLDGLKIRIENAQQALKEKPE